MSDSSADFGFTKVEKNQKTPLVQSVFSRVASRYDIMNDVMSLGIHRLWKSSFCNLITRTPFSSLLDVAGGTGDITFKILDRCQELKWDVNATILDYNQEMLEAGKIRPENKKFPHIDWVRGDAANLCVADQSFDVYTISFGLRNVTDIDAALREAYRILKPGGRYYCLEFSQLCDGTLQKLYDLYSFNLIPKMGELIANDKDAYQYLVESIRKFPDQKTFAKKIEAAGFKNVSFENLSFGIAAIHCGWKF